MFGFLPHPELFPTCVHTVSTTLAQHKLKTTIGSEDVQHICEHIVTSTPQGPGRRTHAVTNDCAELSGRVQEAAKAGRLTDGGSEFCGNLVKENLLESGRSLDDYLPHGSTEHSQFCDLFGSAETLKMRCSMGVVADVILPRSKHDAPVMLKPAGSGLKHEVLKTDNALPSGDFSDIIKQHTLETRLPALSTTAVQPKTASATPAGAAQSQFSDAFLKKNFGKVLGWGDSPPEAAARGQTAPPSPAAPTIPLLDFLKSLSRK